MNSNHSLFPLHSYDLVKKEIIEKVARTPQNKVMLPTLYLSSPLLSEKWRERNKILKPNIKYIIFSHIKKEKRMEVSCISPFMCDHRWKSFSPSSNRSLPPSKKFGLSWNREERRGKFSLSLYVSIARPPPSPGKKLGPHYTNCFVTSSLPPKCLHFSIEKLADEKLDLDAAVISYFFIFFVSLQNQM